MKFESPENFIKKHLRYGQHWNKKLIDLKDAKRQTLEEDTWIAGCEYAAGSTFRVFETTNFGWIIFEEGTRTPDENIPGRRLIKW